MKINVFQEGRLVASIEPDPPAPPAPPYSLVPRDPSDPRDRFERLLTAARETTAWFHDHEAEGLSEEMVALLIELRDAHKAWG